jgi:colanic acid biosynthesis glycosyl transferase WcaI
MKILIVADAYPPEISSAGHLMKELAQGLSNRKHSVTVVTSYPRHYLDTEAQKKTIDLVSFEENIKVIRTKTLPLRKVNFLLRGFSQIILPFLFFKQIKKNIKEELDIAVIYSPPILLGLLSKKIKKRYKAKTVLNVQDIFPQNAIDLGILKNKALIKLFELIEKKSYQEADLITFNSEGGREFLIQKKNLDPKKIITLPNWIDPEPYLDLKQEISFRKEYQLENKFIFLFAGIMGPAQGLEFLIEVALKVSDIKEIVFLLVGDGMEKEKIEKKVREYNLSNVIVKPFVPKEKYPYLVRDADAGIVCLSSKNKTPFLPGKFLGYLIAGKPIVAFLNKESDGFSLIKKAECGYATTSDNLEEAQLIIRKIYNKKEKNFGLKGKEYALENLTAKKCIEKLEKIFNEMIS